jgi:hypothetical protein
MMLNVMEISSRSWQILEARLSVSSVYLSPSISVNVEQV